MLIKSLLPQCGHPTAILQLVDGNVVATCLTCGSTAYTPVAYLSEEELLTLSREINRALLS